MIDRADSTLAGAIHPSPNFGPRRSAATPNILLLHYTGVASAAGAITWLATPKSEVSCHYVVDEDGLITQMVAEQMRAWHAGIGEWAGESDINSVSIGIEIHNQGHDAGYPDFPELQLLAVEKLCRDIIDRHAIEARNVLAHSDVAPARKRDPGEKFPWKTLADSGIGLWVKPTPIDPTGPIFTLGETNPIIEEAQTLLAKYGYDVTASGYLDSVTRDVVAAFQRHFRPQRVDGFIDVSTVSTLKDLLAARDARISASKLG